MDSKAIPTDLTPDGSDDFNAYYGDLLAALDAGEKEDLDTPSEDFTRSLLLSVKGLPQFKEEEEKLPENLRKLLEDFMDGTGVADLIGETFAPPLSYPALEGAQDVSSSIDHRSKRLTQCR